MKAILAAWNEGDFSEAGKYVTPNLATSMNGFTTDSTPEGDGPVMAQGSIEYWRAIMPDLRWTSHRRSGRRTGSQSNG